MSEALVVPLADALARLPLPATGKWPDGTWFDSVLSKPGVQALIFAPHGEDHQTPHDRDEAYVVVRGHATLEIDGDPHLLGPGDLAWVPREVGHRFAAFSDDFAAWVIFTA